MPRTILCQGHQCPNRNECIHHVRYQSANAFDRRMKSIAHCIDGKLFERDPENVHPQHQY